MGVYGGGSGNDQVLGSPDPDQVYGYGGNDTLFGYGGDDTLYGGTGNDTLFGSVGEDILYGGNDDDTLFGGDMADWLLGQAGNDTIQYLDDGGAVDTAYGGTGNDTIVTGVISLAAGSVFDLAAGTFTLGTFSEIWAEFEHYNGSVGSGHETVLGNSADNRITTGAGNNVIDGRAGNDSLIGGAGNDTIHGGDDSDQIRGGTGNDYITGGNGQDSLRGDENADTILAGDGEDVVWYDADGVADTHYGGNGEDWVTAATGFVTGAILDLGAGQFFVGALTEIWQGFEHYDNVTGWGDESILGSAVANIVYMGIGNNTVSGLGGNDSLFGGGGNDSLEGDGGEDFLLGGADNDRLAGGADNDYLSGDEGDDTLDGGAGNDVMSGGGGNDTYVVGAAGDAVSEAAGQGTDTVRSWLASYTLGANVERLELMGSAVTGIGNGLDNTLVGTAAANTLNGGAGNDFMSGGGGNDTYVVGVAGDTVVEAAGGGTDTVQSWMTAYTLGANVERLELQGTAVTGIGNGLNNSLVGTATANTLQGGAGNDFLAGGGGNDQLYGGANADTFVYNNANETPAGAATRDTIHDFDASDIINLANVDANGAGAGNGTFIWRGAGAFTNTAGDLRFSVFGANTIVEGDINGDGVADLQILLLNYTALNAGDFVL